MKFKNLYSKKTVMGAGVLASFFLYFSSVKSASDLIDMEMVLVGKGEFLLNIPVSNSYEIHNLKKVVLIEKSYSIGKYEVTNRQWNICHADKGCSRPANMSEDEKDDHPVVRVNWHDTREFTRWLSKVTKRIYRLPTEEEWSYAAYAGKNTSALEVEYDYNKVSKLNNAPKVTKPKGSYGSNNWGIFDVVGNTWEWTLTCWYSSEENILKKRSVGELDSTEACTTRIAHGEHRSHIPDFIFDTYNGGCATLRPAANLGFRVLREEP